MTEPRTFADEIQRMLRDGFHAEVDTTPILEVRRARTYLPVSCCMLTDTTGVNHCTHPASPPPARRTRARWWLRSRWTRLRYRLGSWIAGTDLDDDD